MKEGCVWGWLGRDFERCVTSAGPQAIAPLHALAQNLHCHARWLPALKNLARVSRVHPAPGAHATTVRKTGDSAHNLTQKAPHPALHTHAAGQWANASTRGWCRPRLSPASTLVPAACAPVNRSMRTRPQPKLCCVHPQPLPRHTVELQLHTPSHALMHAPRQRLQAGARARMPPLPRNHPPREEQHTMETHLNCYGLRQVPHTRTEQASKKAQALCHVTTPMCVRAARAAP